MKNWDATHTWDPRPTTNALTRYIGVQQLHMHGNACLELTAVSYEGFLRCQLDRHRGKCCCGRRPCTCKGVRTVKYLHHPRKSTMSMLFVVQRERPTTTSALADSFSINRQSELDWSSLLNYCWGTGETDCFLTKPCGTFAVSGRLPRACS